VIVHNLAVARRGLAVRPFEADALLLVDPDRELPGPVAPQRLKPVTGQGAQRIERGRGVQDRKPARGLALESLERPHQFPLSELLGRQCTASAKTPHQISRPGPILARTGVWGYEQLLAVLADPNPP
jgi:hypothetical protein